MDDVVFIFTTSFLVVVCLLVGYYLTKNRNSVEQYYFEKKQMGFFSLSLTLLATQIGGGAVIGSAEVAYFHGIKSFYYAAGISLGFVMVSCGLGTRMFQIGAQTIPEIFSLKYNSFLLKKIVACCSVLTLFLILTAVLVAGRKLFYSLGFTQDIFFVIAAIAFIAYTSQGGLKAVVYTDLIQISFIIMIFAVTSFVFFSQQKLHFSHNTLNLNQVSSIFSDKNFLMPFMFTVIGQDMGQRYMSAKSTVQLNLSTLFSAVMIVLISCVPICFGLLAKENQLDLGLSDCVVLESVKIFTNPTVAALFSSAVVCAVVSTADSLLCSMSLNMSYDILGLKNNKTLIGKALSPKSITVLMGVCALLVSFITKDIMFVMIKAYELFATLFFVPIMMAILIKNPPKQAAIVAVGIGLILFTFQESGVFTLIHPLFALGFSCLGYLLILFFYRKD